MATQDGGCDWPGAGWEGLVGDRAPEPRETLPNRRKRGTRGGAPAAAAVLAGPTTASSRGRSLKPNRMPVGSREEYDTDGAQSEQPSGDLQQEDVGEQRGIRQSSRRLQQAARERRTPLPRQNSVPVRDDNGRFIGVRMKTAEERARKNAGGGLFKSTAVEVLRQERRLLTTGDITRLALAKGLLSATGKTPEATMASALYTDVKRKEGRSVFIRPVEGLFGLKEWEPCSFDYEHRLVQHSVAASSPQQQEQPCGSGGSLADIMGTAPATQLRVASTSLPGVVPVPATVRRASSGGRRRSSSDTGPGAPVASALAAQLAAVGNHAAAAAAAAVTVGGPAAGAAMAMSPMGLPLPEGLLTPATLTPELVQQLLVYQQQLMAQQAHVAGLMAQAPGTLPPAAVDLPCKRPAGDETALPLKKRRRRPSLEAAFRPLDEQDGQENDAASLGGFGVHALLAPPSTARAQQLRQQPAVTPSELNAGGTAAGMSAFAPIGGKAACGGGLSASHQLRRGVLVERPLLTDPAASRSDTTTIAPGAAPQQAAAAAVSSGAGAGAAAGVQAECSADCSKGGGATILLLLDAIDELHKSESAEAVQEDGRSTATCRRSVQQCEEVSSPAPKWQRQQQRAPCRPMPGLTLELPQQLGEGDQGPPSNGSDAGTAEGPRPSSTNSEGEQSVFRAKPKGFAHAMATPAGSAPTPVPMPPPPALPASVRPVLEGAAC